MSKTQQDVPPITRKTGEWERRASGLLSAFQMDSIKSRIVVFAVLATLIPSVSTAWLAHNQNRRSLTDRINDDLKGVAVRSARETDIWLRDLEFDVRIIAESYPVGLFLAEITQFSISASLMSARAAEMTAYLDQARRSASEFAQLLLLNDLGQLVAGTAASDTVRVPGGWNSDDATDVAIGAPYWDSSLGRRVLVLAMPIRELDGTRLGGLAATVELDSLGSALRAEFSSQDLEVFVMDRNGLVLASSNYGGVPEGVVLTSAARESLTAADTAAVQFPGYDRQAALGVQSTVSRMGWTVVARIPAETAFARINELRNKTFLILLGLLAVLGLMAYQLALIIVKPLVRLTAGVAKVATGDFEVDLPVTVQGEVGALTRVFNTMVGRLREGRDRLNAVHGELLQQNERLELVSKIDVLTGLFNRRSLMETTLSEIVRARRMEHELSLVIMDVDHFKRFNDSYGHLVGDEVLRCVGQVLAEVTRETDFAARYGGEEFVVLLPETDLIGGVDLAERIRDCLALRKVDAGDGKTEKITLSIGVSTFPEFGDTPDLLISAADAAMYRAKKAGRDRVFPAQQREPGKEATAATKDPGRS